MAALVQTVAPAAEPVLATEQLIFARIDDPIETNLVTDLLVAAREMVEELTHLQCIAATYEQYLDEFPPVILLRKSPVSTVSSVTYTDSDGAVQTLATTEYQYDLNAWPARVMPAYGKSWPTSRAQLNSVKVSFVAGFGASGASVPQRVRQAIRLLAAHWFENREETMETDLKIIPHGVRALLNTSKVGRVTYEGR